MKKQQVAQQISSEDDFSEKLANDQKDRRQQKALYKSISAKLLQKKDARTLNNLVGDESEGSRSAIKLNKQNTLGSLEISRFLKTKKLQSSSAKPKEIKTEEIPVFQRIMTMKMGRNAQPTEKKKKTKAECEEFLKNAIAQG